MNPTKEFFDFVRVNAGADPAALRLKFGSRKEPFDYAAAIVQIECRRRFGKKLAATLEAFPDFYFPTVLAGEQATADLVAAFNASFIPEALPVADLTAGLGIDALHAAARASKVVAVERDECKVEALRFNAAGLHLDNVEAVQGDCRDVLRKAVDDGTRYAAVFIDPARRGAEGQRVFALADCEPDVVEMLPLLRGAAELLIIKASPMLDIAHTIAALEPAPVAVMAVGTATECKELLVVVDFENPPAETMIEAVTLGKDGADTFAFTRSSEAGAPEPLPAQGLVAGDYIFEPSPALMKSGAYRLLAQRYGLMRFHPNTRLFASHTPVDAGLNGQNFRVVQTFPFASGVLKRFARTYPAVNVAVRNFDMSADALRAKLGVRDAGPLRLYGITDASGKRLLVLTEPA